MTRRDLLKHTLTAGIFTAASYNKIMGANERLNVGFIGTGIMGRGNMSTCLDQPDASISWLCDVYDEQIRKAVYQCDKNYQKLTKDFRYVLEDRDTDAVCISTPDHWHAYMTVEAFKSGKHVYCEKPIAHRFEEIQKMAKAQRKYNRVFQSGQWQRSSSQFMQAIDVVGKGKIGPVYQILTWLFGYDAAIGRCPNSQPPAGLDEQGWDMWLGPAPYRPFNWNRFTTNPETDPKRQGFSTFRYFWDHANGMLGDWGPHLLDIAFWGLGWDTSERIVPIDSRGGKSEVCNGDDDKETPNFWQVSYSSTLVDVHFVHNGCDYSKPPGMEHGIEFFGPEGSVVVNRSLFQLKDKDGKVVEDAKPTNNALDEHWKDFLNAVRCVRLDTRAGMDKIAFGNAACILGGAAQRAVQSQADDGKLVWLHKPSFTDDKVIGIKKEHIKTNYRKPWKLKV